MFATCCTCLGWVGRPKDRPCNFCKIPHAVLFSSLRALYYNYQSWLTHSIRLPTFLLPWQTLEALVVPGVALNCKVGLTPCKPRSQQAREQCLREDSLSSIHADLISTFPSGSARLTCFHKWIWYLPGVCIGCDCASHSPCSCQSHRVQIMVTNREAQKTFSQPSLSSEGGFFQDLITHFSSGTHHSSFLPVASGCTCSPKRAKGLHWLELDVQVNSCSRLTQLNLLQASQLSLFQQCPILVFSCWLKGSSRRKHRSCDLLWEGCREQKPKWAVTGADCLQRGLCNGSKLPSNQTPLYGRQTFLGEEKYADLQAWPCPRKSRVLLTPRSAPCKLWGTFYFCTSKAPCGYQSWEKYSILR